MKKIVLFFIFLASFYKSQEVVLKGGYHSSTEIMEMTDEIELQPQGAISVGSYYLEFENGKLKAGEVGNFCSLSCRMSHEGSYQVSGQKISMKIDSTFYAGQCSSGDGFKKNPKPLGEFYIVKFPTSIILMKELKNIPKRDYYKNLNLKLPRQKSSEHDEIMTRYRDLYNQAFQVKKDKAPATQLLISRIWRWMIYCEATTTAENLDEARIFYKKMGYDLLKMVDGD